MNYPKVSIIILNWNGLEDTIECLESLRKITYPNYEIIIVDNASAGKDVVVLKEMYGEYAHIITNDKNYGYPEGNNVGMRHALNKGTDYVLVLNNDVIVDPGFLSEMIRLTEADISIGFAGPKIYYYYHPSRIQSTGGKINWWLGETVVYGDVEDKGQYDNIAERDFIFGTCMLIKKEVIENISYMDPYYFFGVEEFDYCTRARRAGYKIVYVPQSIVWHKVGASFAKVAQYPETNALIRKNQGFRKYKYSYRLFKKYCPPVLFMVPFFFHIVVQTQMYRHLAQLLQQRDWSALQTAIIKKAKRL